MNRIGNERLGNQLIIIPVAASTSIDEGVMVAINADGYAVPAAKATGLTVAGRCELAVDNKNKTAGALSVRVKRGVFVYANSTTGAVKETDLLKKCFVEDSETVTITSEESSMAGTILEADGEFVTVEIK
jgi:hypothetical protein